MVTESEMFFEAIWKNERKCWEKVKKDGKLAKIRKIFRKKSGKYKIFSKVQSVVKAPQNAQRCYKLL